MYGVSQDFYHSTVLDIAGWLTLAAVGMSAAFRFLAAQRNKASKCHCMIMQERRDPKIGVQTILTAAFCIFLIMLLSEGNTFGQSTSDQIFLKGNGEALLIAAVCLLLWNKVAANFIRFSQFWKKVLFLTAGILASVISGVLWELNFAGAGATWLFFAGLAFYAYWNYPRRHEDS